MSPNEDDNLDADDASEVPAYEGSSHRSPRKKLPVAALLLSLTCHVAAGAALTTWALRHLSPTLQVAGGAGAGTASVLAGDAAVTADVPDLGQAPVESGSAEEFEVSGLPLADGDFDAAVIGFSSSMPAQSFSSNAMLLSASSSSIPLPAPRVARRDVADASGNGISAGGSPIPDSTNRPPRYPREALQRKWQGTVVVEVEVAEGGNVRQARLVESSGHDVLDAAALDAVRRWHFNATDGGRLAFAWTGTVPVEFVLKKRT